MARRFICSKGGTGLVPERNKKVSRKCPVCLHDTGTILHHQHFAVPPQHLLPDSYDVISCSFCGFVYADTDAVQADYDHYYRECSKYEDPTVATGGGMWPLDAERMERTACDISRQVPFRETRILDVGCANGGLLAALGRKGYRRLTGLDPSRACTSFVRKCGFASVEGGLFSEVLHDQTVFSERFNLIILSHVLEHVHDVRTALGRLLNLLEENGEIYVEVPDASRYANYYVVPYYYFDCEHINHFDENALRNLFQQFGFTCLETARKEIRVSAAVLYPVIYAFFRKDGAVIPSETIHPDFSARESVRQYVEMSASRYRTDVLSELARSQRRLIVWGAGSYTLRLLEDTPLGQCNIVAFVDNDKVKQGTRLRNVLIHSPQILRGLSALIVVSAALHSDSILEEIRRMNLTHEVIVL